MVHNPIQDFHDLLCQLWTTLVSPFPYICCASAWDKAKLGMVDGHQLSDEAVHNPLQDFHDLLCHLQTTLVSPFPCIPLTFVEADSEILLQVREYLAIVIDCSCKVTDLRGALVIGLAMHLAASYDALVPLPVFQALKAFPLLAIAFPTCSLPHQVSRRQ